MKDTNNDKKKDSQKGYRKKRKKERKKETLTNNNLPNPIKMIPQCCFICRSTCFTNNQRECDDAESDHEYFSFTMHVDFNFSLQCRKTEFDSECEFDSE